MTEYKDFLAKREVSTMKTYENPMYHGTKIMPMKRGEFPQESEIRTFAHYGCNVNIPHKCGSEVFGGTRRGGSALLVGKDQSSSYRGMCMTMIERLWGVELDESNKYSKDELSNLKAYEGFLKNMKSEKYLLTGNCNSVIPHVCNSKQGVLHLSNSVYGSSSSRLGTTDNVQIKKLKYTLCGNLYAIIHQSTTYVSYSGGVYETIKDTSFNMKSWEKESIGVPEFHTRGAVISDSNGWSF